MRTPKKLTRRSWLVRTGFLAGATFALGPRTIATPQQYPRDLTASDIARWMKDLSNWGRWGKEDQAGTVNLITAQKRRAAAQLVRDGVNVSMSLDAHLPPEGEEQQSAPPTRGGQEAGRPRYTWQLNTRPPRSVDPNPVAAYVIDNFSVSYHGNNSTHLDSLAHMYIDGHFYNGFPVSEVTERGVVKNDVMPYQEGILSRGVLFDIPRLKNVPYLGEDEPIYPEDLEAWGEKAGFRTEAGDVVFIRTGRWLHHSETGEDWSLNRATPGLHASCAQWLHERDIAILGSDVVQDVRPSRVEGVNQPLHQLCLIAMGTPLLDNCDLEAVAQAAEQRRRWAFMVTIHPLRIPGATGGPVNPIATF